MNIYFYIRHENTQWHYIKKIIHILATKSCQYQIVNNEFRARINEELQITGEAKHRWLCKRINQNVSTNIKNLKVNHLIRTL